MTSTSSIEIEDRGWGFSSVVERLPRKRKAGPGFGPQLRKKEPKKKKKRNRRHIFPNSLQDYYKSKTGTIER